MKYKMIVTDMDDTLINSNGEISKENREAIIRAQEMGVKFVLASGRPTAAMEKEAKELQLDKFGSYILSYNGGVITNCKDNTICFQEQLSVEEAHRLEEVARENSVDILTYYNGQIISPKISEYVQVEIDLTRMDSREVSSFKDEVKEAIPKCIMLEEPKYLKKVEEKLQEEMGDEYSITISKPIFLEVMKKGIDKGKSLLWLGEKLGVKKEEMIAVGDSYNDISMLSVVGMPIGVANAKDEVKEIVKYIATSSDDHALEDVINKFIIK